MKVAAVVVTYNRLTLLKKCISSLNSQTKRPDEIIVVNNGSSDGTTEWLEKHGSLTVINQQNLGSAGGQITGLKHAIENGFDWVWCMDDDGFPGVHCLQKLYNSIEMDSSIDVWGAIACDIDDPTMLAFETPNAINKIEDLTKKFTYIDNWAPFFNGVMLSRSIILKVGFPMNSLFIWGEEREYFYRILMNGGKIRTNLDAIFYHPKDRLYSKKYRGKYVYDGPLDWKGYCFFRNNAYLGKRYFKSYGIKYIINQVLYFKSKYNIRNSLYATKFLISAYKDGLMNNLDRKLPF